MIRRRPPVEPDLSADTILARLGATHDTHGRFTGRKGARPMCTSRPDDDPSQHDQPRAAYNVSPWVRSALAHTLSAREGEPVADVLRRTMPPVGPTAFEPRPIHAEDECPDPAECLAVHTVARR